jgi:hypothetical protein
MVTYSYCRRLQVRAGVPARLAFVLAGVAVFSLGGCPQPQGTLPNITSFGDATGGRLVVGDFVEATGQNLSLVTAVLVGEKQAAIVAQDDATLRFQIPQGVKSGAETIHLQYQTAAGGTAELTDSIEVHRLAAFVGASNGWLVIVDTLDQSVVRTLNVGTYDGNAPFIPATANNGSLAIVPTGVGRLYWVDLTADPPKLGFLDLSGAVQQMGVAMPPSGDVAAVSDLGASLVHGVRIQESLPPYSDPIAKQGDPLPLDRPRPGVFFAADRLVIPLQVKNELAILRPRGATIGSTAFVDTLTRVDSGNVLTPTEALLSPDGTQVLVPAYTNGQVRLYTVSATGPVLTFATSVQPIMQHAFALAFHPSGKFAYLLDPDGNQVFTIQIDGSTLTTLTPGVALSGTGPVSIAVDPVEGKFLYVGMDGAGYVDIFDISDGGKTLTRRTTNPLAGITDLKGTRGILIQP